MVLLLIGIATTSRGAEPPRVSGAAQDVDWSTSPLDLDLRGMNGERYVVRCPPHDARAAHVVGSGPYTDISPICAASVHAGALDPGTGGTVEIEIRPGTDNYIGMLRNGIRSESLRAHWSGSFIVVPTSRAGSPAPR